MRGGGEVGNGVGVVLDWGGGVGCHIVIIVTNQNRRHTFQELPRRAKFCYFDNYSIRVLVEVSLHNNRMRCFKYWKKSVCSW